MDETTFSGFPKIRPPLPIEYQSLYARHYKENRTGQSTASSLSQRMERWMHRQVARDVIQRGPMTTLEIGAGTLNQLSYEPEGAPYDVVEPMVALYSDSPQRGRVRAFYQDMASVPSDRRYMRITSVAALEHVCELPSLIARAALLLEPTGSFRAAIPSEGGFLWQLGWKMTTGLEFRFRHGLDYGVLMKHEHVNTAAEIEAVVRALFSTCRLKSFGIGRQLSLYRFIEAGSPRFDVARKTLAA